jgi:putative hemin transport protein
LVLLQVILNRKEGTAMHVDTTAAPLAERYRLHRVANPRQYPRDSAAALGVSELELLLAVETHQAIPLRTDDLEGLLNAIPALGAVKSVTRNESVVLERVGTYGTPTFFGPVAQLLGEIDLRIFPGQWAHAFAVRPPEGRVSLQWFDAHGVAVHKIHLEPSQAFDALVESWRLDVAPGLELQALASPAVELSPPADLAQFRAEWDALTDTHEFHGLLRRHQLTRLAALRHAGEPRARRVAVASLGLLLEAARDAGQSIMTFVGNRGVIQIHSGVPQRVMRTPGWLNIMDPEINLHVREADLAEAWVVRKPGSGGTIASLELFDAHGSDVLLVFGKRADDAPASVTEPFAALLDAMPTVGA